MAGAEYTVDLISTLTDLVILEPDWNRLSEAAQAPNAFTTFGWFRAWSERLTREAHSGEFRPHVMVLKHGGTLAGLCPLTFRRASRFGLAVRKIEFAGIYADYNDLMLGDDPAGQIEAVIDYLAATSEQWDILDLRDLRDNGEEISLLKSALSRARLPFLLSPEQDSCPYLPIDGNAACLMKRLSGRRRKHMRKQIERASAEGLKIRIVENPQDEPHLLKTLIELERKKQMHRPWAVYVGAYQEVFQSLFDSLGPHGWLYVALLELQGQPIAFQLGFRCGNKLWDYTKAYDRSYSNLSPGTLILPALLDYGFEHRYDEYDFLRGEEPYKVVWSTGCHTRFRLMVWSRRQASRMRKFIYYDVKSAMNSFSRVLSPAKPEASPDL